MARAKNQWKAFSFKKLQELNKQLEVKLGKEKVVTHLSEILKQSQTAVRGYLARRMIPNQPAQEKLASLLKPSNFVKTSKPVEASKVKVLSQKNTPPAAPENTNTSKEISIPLTVLRKLATKMPITDRELNVLETLLTR